MTPLFLYGTLRDPALLAITSGRDDLAPVSATWPGARVVWAAGESFPLALEGAGEIEGLLIEAPTPEVTARLDFYERCFGYVTKPVTVTVDGGPRAALVWLPEANQWPAGDPWSLVDWQAQWGALSRLAAAEVMEGYGQRDPAELGQWFPSIRARAQAKRFAADEAPKPRPGLPEAGDVAVSGVDAPYAKFFRVEEHHLRFPNFAGGLSDPVTRAVFVMSDAVTVVPYDPVRDRVLLIEQFRVGPYARGDRQPWLREPVAGRIDPGESPDAAAHRELAEEANLTAKSLHLVNRCYPSPGAVTEYLHSYVALCDLPDSANGLGGLAVEAEDIRSTVYSYDAVIGFADDGQLRATPLFASVLWLARHRERLRAL